MLAILHLGDIIDTFILIIFFQMTPAWGTSLEQRLINYLQSPGFACVWMGERNRTVQILPDSWVQLLIQLLKGR